MAHIIKTISGYECLTQFNTNQQNGVFLVRRCGTRELFVMRIIEQEMRPVYEQLQKIDDKHIAKIYEIIQLAESPQMVVIEEFVNGETLRNILSRKGKLSPQTAIAYVKEISSTMKKLHKFNIIHRDLNPNNIMITFEGTLKIVDFGIGRIVKKDKSKDTMVLGTSGYAAPEQFGYAQTDARADIYAVGVILNEMLTGYLPQEKLYAGTKKLQKIIRKACEITTEKRYQDMNELHSAISEINPLAIQEYGGFLGLLPGFRTGIWWKKVIAIFLYLAFLSLDFIVLIYGFPVNVSTIAYQILLQIMLVILPFILYFNVAKIDYRLPIFRNVPLKIRRWIRYLAAIMLQILAIIISSHFTAFFRYGK